MPFTTLKGFSVQTAGTNNNLWGDSTQAGLLPPNGNDLNGAVITPMDGMVSGISSFGASANIVLSATDVQNCCWRISGVIASNITITPATGSATAYLNGFYYFENVTTGGAFTVTVVTAAGSCLLPQSTRGSLFIDASLGPRVVGIAGATNPAVVPIGVVTSWFQGAAPLGWTQRTDTIFNQGTPQIVTDGSGGGSGGSIGFPTVFGRTATDAYVLQIADMPAHTHTFTWDQSVMPFGGSPCFLSLASGAGAQPVVFAGGGGGHMHGLNLQVLYSSWLIAQYTG